LLGALTFFRQSLLYNNFQICGSSSFQRSLGCIKIIIEQGFFKRN